MNNDKESGSREATRLRFLIDSATAHALIATDPQGRINFWSKGAETLFGWSTGEVLGKSAAFIFTEEDREADMPAREMERAAQHGSAEDIRWHLRKDGSRFWGNGVMNRLDDGSGFVKIARDWTQQHKTEQALQASENKTRQIIDSAVEYAIFTTDRDGRITTWNKGAERVMGYTEREITGADVRILFLPGERDHGAVEQEMADALRTGSAHAERYHLRRDGTTIWASETLMPLQNDGEPKGFLKILRDRSEEKRTIDALRRSEARFRVLATTLPALIWRAREDGMWIWASPQWTKFTGQTSCEASARGWLEAIHPDDRALTMKAWRDAAEAGAFYAEHRLAEAGTNTYRWFQTRAVPLRGETGEIGEWFGSSTDVDEMKQLQAQQRVLLAELQHRSRNLITVVQSISSQTIASSQSLADYSKRFESRLSAISRVQGLISRTDENAATIRAIVTLELAAHGAEPDGKTVIVEGPPVTLPGTMLQTLTLALHELATNALKYGALAQPGGLLEILWKIRSADDEAERLVLEWREHGVPLGEEFAPKRRGFGRQLIESALVYELDSTSHLEFTPDGVRCLIDVPLKW